MTSPSSLPRQAYFAATVESSDIAFIGESLDGVLHYCNPAAVRMFGYTEAELAGRSVTILLPPERSHEETAILARVRSGDRVENYETVRVAKDGRRLEVSVTVAPVRDASGAVVAAAKILREITERSRAEEVRARLGAIVESSDDAIISKDLDGVIHTFNAAAERLFGYTAAEVVGRPVTILIPPERLHEEPEILARMRRGERIDHFETVRISKDGRRIDISLSVSPIRAASGETIGVSKIARDITETKRIAQALAAQREWFRVTLDSIGDAVIACDPSGSITYMNGPAERLTGWAGPEWAGQPLDDIFHIVSEKTRRPIEHVAAQVLKTRKVIDAANHTVLISRDGTEWPIANSAAPILDDTGATLGVVLVFHDVTEQRRGLETARAARAEAERANRVKDDFVAMVSHELRTPLNAILGWTDLLRTRPPDPGTLQHGLEVVARNTRLQAQLISDLLDISRIVSGKLRLDVGTVDLCSIIEEALESVQHAADAKRIEIRRKLDRNLGPMVADPARLQQVIWNLLSNAIKFTAAGGRVEVGLRRLGAHAEITVTDNGPGISPELLPNLFERFRPGGVAATVRSPGGLGLGLPIVKHLVELHGGTVRGSSQGEGKGATFTIELPMTSAFGALDAEEAPDAGEPSTAQADDALQNIKVLVVEDEADARDLIRRILELHHAEVVVAANGPEAMELLSSTCPDILLSDIGLPEMDGYELIHRIRGRHDAASRIPAIALTAFARFEDRTRALRAGYQTHIGKPVEPSELVAAVASFAELIAAQRKQ